MYLNFTNFPKFISGAMYIKLVDFANFRRPARFLQQVYIRLLFENHTGVIIFIFHPTPPPPLAAYVIICERYSAIF